MNYPALHLFHSAKVHIKFEITNIFYIKRIFDKPFYLLTKTAGIPLLHTHTRAREPAPPQTYIAHDKTPWLGLTKWQMTLTKCHDKMAGWASPCVNFTQEPKIENFAFLSGALIVQYGRTGFLTPQF